MRTARCRQRAACSKALGRPPEPGDAEVAVTATVGVALYPTDADSVDALLQNADFAVFNAREYHRNTCQFYSPELRVRTRHREAWRAKIEKGLASLTPREREVQRILVAGNANKAIGYMLGTSMRTIENHRASIMKKMDARSLPELVRMVIEIRGHAAIDQYSDRQREGTRIESRRQRSEVVGGDLGVQRHRLLGAVAQNSERYAGRCRRQFYSSRSTRTQRERQAVAARHQRARGRGIQCGR